MAEIPRKVTVNIIDDAIQEKHKEGHRSHLGGSIIGHPCMRHIWYSFRWHKKEQVSGRMQRLFQRGHLEEERFCEYLKLAGFEIKGVKPEPQMRFSMLGGHFSCELDGLVRGIPEAPNKWHVLEFKTYSEKKFLELVNITQKEYKKVKDGIPFLVDTKLRKKQHFFQMQTGMGMAQANGIEVDRALYLAVNKNDDCIAQERLRFSQTVFNNMVDKAEAIIFGTVKPPRISNNPAWFECTFCTFKGICHGEEESEKNCRTCKMSKPCRDGGWYCETWQDKIPAEAQRKEYHCHVKP